VPAAPKHTVLRVLICVALILLCVRAFVVEPIGVPTASMSPTLPPGDSVLVNKVSYRFGEPQRGDIIVFHRPGNGELMLKRIVAVGGDRVGIEDGVLHVNGHAVPERYVDHRTVDSVYYGPVRVPPASVFVMGDQRANSIDSRAFGAIPRRRIVGRVDLRIWPPSQLGAL